MGKKVVRSDAEWQRQLTRDLVTRKKGTERPFTGAYPEPSGQRYCMSSASLKLMPKKQEG
jgi:peptide methionine sulfoxide reductase MsrB